MKLNVRLIFYLMIAASWFCTDDAIAQSYFPPITGNDWDTVSPASLGWCVDKIAPLSDYVGSKNSKAFIILVDGKIVIEKYFGTFTQDSIWYWASAGKTLTAFMVGMAQQESFLSINDTTSKYLGNGWTDCTPQQEEKITIRNQLTMTSGLDDGVPDHYCTIDTCLIYKADAGTRWAYHNGPYTLLDPVIENAVGQSLNAYTTLKLKAPTGMTGSFIKVDFNNVFFSKPRSMARFGHLILNKGNWNGNQIMTDTGYFNQMVNTSQLLNESYGYLWWLNGKSTYMVPGLQIKIPGSLMPNAPSDMIAALGKNGQFINVVPSEKLVLIRMGNSPGVGEVPFLFNDTIWQKLNEVMCGSTGIGESIKQTHLKIFPNPASKVLKLEMNQKIAECNIYNNTGHLVLKDNPDLDHDQIDVSGLENGLYFVRIRLASGEVSSHKLIIQQ